MSAQLFYIDDRCTGFFDPNGILTIEKDGQYPAETIWTQPLEAFAMRLVSVHFDGDVDVLIHLNGRPLEAEFTAGIGVRETDRLSAVVFETDFDHGKIKVCFGD